MTFDIITIFPGIFDSYLNESILKRAQKNKLIKIKIHNLRDFTKDKHKKVDDRPFGGGPGMVLYAEPIVRAVMAAKTKKGKTKIILFEAGGKQFDDKLANQFSKKDGHFIMICGHYEGVDERIKKVIRDLGFVIQEISIGPYVLTGGELAAMVLIDAISRKIPGVLGKTESLEEKRLGVGIPMYTRPAEFKYKGKSYKVPKVLIGGNHAEIEKWRLKNKK